MFTLKKIDLTKYYPNSSYGKRYVNKSDMFRKDKIAICFAYNNGRSIKWISKNTGIDEESIKCYLESLQGYPDKVTWNKSHQKITNPCG